MRPLLTLLSAAFATGCFFYVLALRQPLIESDTFVHLAVGRLVASEGVPHTDPFSFTRRGEPWRAHGWLAGWLFYGAHSIGGLGLLCWLAAAATVATALLVGMTARERGVSSPGSILIAQALALLLIGAVFCVRPHVLTVLFLAGQGWLLARFERTRGASTLVLLIPLFLLWANCHGGFVIGGLPFASTALNLAWTGTSHRDLRRLAWASAACLAATAVNPYGIELIAMPFRFVTGNSALHTITEWMPPDLATCSWQLAYTYVILVAIAAGHRAVRPGDALALAVAYGLWLSSRRHLVVVAVIAPPILAASLSTIRARLSSGPARQPPVGVETVIAFLVACLISFPFSVFRDYLHEDQFPRTCAFLIERERPAGRVFHEAGVGGFLAFRRIPVFIDWRAELYSGTPVLDEYNRLMNLEPGWEQVLERYQIDWALVHPFRPLAAQLSTDPRWSVACSDRNHVMYRRVR